MMSSPLFLIDGMVQNTSSLTSSGGVSSVVGSATAVLKNFTAEAM